MYDPDPLRSFPKAQRGRVHRAVILGRPVAPELAAVAAGHARHLRWLLVLGTVFAVLGAVMLVVSAFFPPANWSSWLSPASFLVAGAIGLFFGLNARRAAQVEHHQRR